MSNPDKHNSPTDTPAPASVSLTRMRPGQSGRIVRIDAGFGLLRKLHSLGIREGSIITKVSGQWMRGPVLVQQNNTQAALGFGMASRVFVQLVKQADKK